MDRRKFLTFAGCSCCSIILNSCATAPITERKQLKIIPEAKLNAQAAQAYEQIKEKEKLSEDLAKLNEIKEIGKKMEDSIGEYFYQQKIDDPTVNFDWEYILIDNDKIRNAWCMPGGKIAFYTGILDVAANNDGLASIMGHEIAHAVARHSVERASQALAINVGTTILDIALEGALSSTSADDYLVNLGLSLPFNRLQESEADYLGLAFMTMAKYDNHESYKVWQRMAEAQKGNASPEFLSTHPSPKNRIEKLKNWIPEVDLRFT